MPKSLRLRLYLATAAMLCASGAAMAQELLIGVAAPISGPMALLGRQVETGARGAAEAISDWQLDLRVEDDACTSEGGVRVARAFVEAKVAIVAGFLCSESLEAALPILKEAGIATITPGVRIASLTDRRERTGWLVYRLAPRDDAERAALAERLIPLWRDELFAIVDDGTIYGRELAESFRAAAEETALKPVFVDTFRPQLDNQVGLVGRLRRAGATHVLAGGDREDIAIMGRDAAALDYPLTIAGGEALRAATVNTPLADGTLMIAPPLWSEVTSPDVLARYAERRQEPEGYVLPAHAAMEVAVAALAEAETSGRPLVEVMGERQFDTAIGPVRFDAKGDLAENPFRLSRFTNNAFVEVPR